MVIVVVAVLAASSVVLGTLATLNAVMSRLTSPVPAAVSPPLGRGLAAREWDPMVGRMSPSTKKAIIAQAAARARLLPMATPPAVATHAGRGLGGRSGDEPPGQRVHRDSRRVALRSGRRHRRALRVLAR